MTNTSSREKRRKNRKKWSSAKKTLLALLCTTAIDLSCIYFIFRRWISGLIWHEWWKLRVNAKVKGHYELFLSLKNVTNWCHIDVRNKTVSQREYLNNCLNNFSVSRFARFGVSVSFHFDDVCWSIDHESLRTKNKDYDKFQANKFIWNCLVQLLFMHVRNKITKIFFSLEILFEWWVELIHR